MFLVSKPTRSEVDAFIDRSAETALSYPDVGTTRSVHPGDLSSYNVDHNRILIGNGDAAFQKAKQAVREWRMFDMPWVELCWPITPIDKERTVAILIRHFGFYSLNAARIVYTIDEDTWFGFAYGTLEDHGESGEERFSVLFDERSGDVVYDLFAFSRPNHSLAKLGYPLTRMLQKRFAADSQQAMLRAVRDNRIN